MEVWGGSEQHGNIASQEEGISSKWHTSVEVYKDNGDDRRGNKYARAEIEEQ